MSIETTTYLYPTEVTNLYIDHLCGPVSYDGKTRPRVRHIDNWKRCTDSILKHGEQLDILEDPDRKVYIWSDQHFVHRNIIKYSNRPFKDVPQMNEMLIHNFNRTVGPDDISIWAGDVGFMPDEKINEILNRCNGYKILVIGNHDFNKKKLRNLDGFDEIHLTYHLYVNYVDYVITHYPMDNLPIPAVNIHGHTHTNVLDSVQHINVCVECCDYTPLSFDEVLKQGRMRALEMVDM